MANPYFKILSKKLADQKEDGFNLDAEIETSTTSVAIHKIILVIFSSHLRDSRKIDTVWKISATGYRCEDVTNLVDFLYIGDTELGEKATELIKTLRLDLSVDRKIRHKKIHKGESVKNVINLELKYLRNLVFEIEMPKLLHNPHSLTDITIKIEQKLFRCHKVILCAMSMYFQAMFSSGMKEVQNDTIRLNGIESAMFSVILNYIYTGKNPLKISNAQDLLAAAVYLQIETLISLCEEFLIAHTDVGNCVDVWKLGNAYNCDLLIKKTWIYITDHFKSVKRSQLINGLNEADLLVLLQEDNLNIEEEKDVLEFVLDWVTTNNQVDSLEKIIQNIRLPLIDKVAINIITRKHEYCVPIIQKVIAEQIKSDDNKMNKPRKEKTFVVLKRTSYMQGISVACYSISQKKWFNLSSNTVCSGGTGYSTCSTDEDIYLSGSNKLYKFSVAENQWTSLKDMTNGRQCHASGVVDGAVYVLGGSNSMSNTATWEFTVISNIEKYNIKEDSWEVVGNMEIPTYDSAYATIKTRIYIFGGAIGNIPGVYVKDIQCFDTVSNTCTKIYYNLPFTVSLAVACTSNNDIYITCPSGQIIHYNEESSPSIVSDTKGSQLMGFATVFHDNALYIMGGYSVIGETDAVHKFDLHTRKQIRMSHLKLPFTKHTNEYSACVKHVSRKFLNRNVTD